MTASGSPEESSINKPAAGRTGAAGDEALSALRASGDRRNAEKSAAPALRSSATSAGVEESRRSGNSSIQKESKETGF
jgi:hypothetical protein